MRDTDADGEPGFLSTILRALADIPRSQPIRDDLERIAAISSKARRLRAVTDGMTPAVDAAIERAVGAQFFLLPLAVPRLAKARERIQAVAAREAGFAYSAYGHLKLRLVLDDAAALLGTAVGADPSGEARLRGVLRGAARERGGFHPESVAQGDGASEFVMLLRGLDTGFRVRRLRFVLRRLGAIAAGASAAERAAADAHKRELYAALAPFLELRRPSPVLAGLAEVAMAGRGDEALDGLAEHFGLTRLDAAGDAAILAIGGLYGGRLPRAARQSVVRAWLGFPFYDIALLPLMGTNADAADSFDELKVDRISPDDAQSLMRGDARATLKGWQINAFGAFFSRAWRENDYLWGRLHAAERLVEIVGGAGEGLGAEAAGVKRALFRAILESERLHLDRVQPLIGELLERVEAMPG